MNACALCSAPGGEVLVEEVHWRLVLVDEPDYPGLCRVIWNAHVAEMSDLSPDERDLLMQVVMQVEETLRMVLVPDKMNLASLGNQVPHLHWHVIPRYIDDAHFPQPIWAAAQRLSDPERIALRRSRLPALRAALRARFAP